MPWELRLWKSFCRMPLHKQPGSFVSGAVAPQGVKQLYSEPTAIGASLTYPSFQHKARIVRNWVLPAVGWDGKAMPYSSNTIGVQCPVPESAFKRQLPKTMPPQKSKAATEYSNLFAIQQAADETASPYKREFEGDQDFLSAKSQEAATRTLKNK